APGVRRRRRRRRQPPARAVRPLRRRKRAALRRRHPRPAHGPAGNRLAGRTCNGGRDRRRRARPAQRLAAGIRGPGTGVPAGRQRAQADRLAPHRPGRHRPGPHRPAPRLRISMPRTALTLCMLLCLLPAACGGDRAAAGQSAAAEDALPAPAAGTGPVTGMPPPGPSTPDPGQQVVAPAPLPDIAGVPDGEAAAAPGAEAAVAVLRDYYAAIEARDYARAYAQWEDGGRASGQTPEQFANGFADTRAVALSVGQPGRIDAGAGQRHIEIPVSLQATRSDGGIRRYAGSYVLHLTVVDGATPEQRSWHIASASLNEVVP